MWYLVFAGMVSYLGPMTKDECYGARLSFPSAECRQAHAMKTCEISPGRTRACPDFDAASIFDKFPLISTWKSDKPGGQCSIDATSWWLARDDGICYAADDPARPK